MTAHDQYREDLPLYAVGALPAEESAALKGHLEQCLECREELRVLNEAAAQIALAVDPATPRAELRERLIARVENESSVVRAKEPVRTGQGWSAWFWIPAFAAAILAIAVAVLWTRDRDALQTNRDLATRLEASEAASQQAENLINTLKSEDAQRVTLVATGAKVQPEAKAVYSLRRRSLVLLASNLTPLPPDKTYELWLLPASGAAPVPAGTFKPDTQGSATLVVSQLANAVPAKAFAVTIENEPGSAAPTMPIILSGTP